MTEKRKLVWWKKLIVLVLVLFGVSVIAYPYVCSFLSSLRQSQVIDGYLSDAASESRLEQDAMLQEAEEYNAKLLDSTVIMTEPFSAEAYQEALSDYNSILAVTDTGMMGYIDIPAINVHLPIYHGTGSDVLQHGVGHLETTSFPVGGESTHAVLSAHSGLPQSKLFTDLDDLKAGDTFYITILNREIWYQVYDIEVVLPEEIASLYIQRGKDLCTLVTCTPYGINTHRLLVHGERISAPETEEELADVITETAPEEQDTSSPLRRILLVALAASLLSVLLVIAVIVRRRKSRKKRDRK